MEIAQGNYAQGMRDINMGEQEVYQGGMEQNMGMQQMNQGNF